MSMLRKWCANCGRLLLRLTVHQLLHAMLTHFNVHRPVNIDESVTSWATAVRLHATMIRRGWRSASVPTAPRYGVRHFSIHTWSCPHSARVPYAFRSTANGYAGCTCSSNIRRCWMWMWWTHQISHLTPSGSATRCVSVLHMCSMHASHQPVSHEVTPCVPSCSR